MISGRPRRSLALELTRRCPARCLYCYAATSKREARADDEPSTAELLGVVDAALAGGRFSRADLTGGEPMSRADFFDIVDRVNGHGVRWAVVTDGASIGASEARHIAKRQALRVQPTILSADAEVHDRLKGRTSLPDTLHAIALLKRHEVPVSVAFICTRLNYDHLEEVLRLCRALGVDHLAFTRLCAAGAALRHDDEIWPEPWMVAKCLSELGELGRRHHVETFNAIAVPHCVWPGGGRCSIASGVPNYTVDPWGAVRPCSVSTAVLGTLVHDGWETIEGRYRTDILPLAARAPRECAGCERWRECGGGCRESGKGRHGGWDGVDPLASGLTCAGG